MVARLLAIVVTSRSPRRAQAWTTLPLRCRTSPRSMSGSTGSGAGTPSSSANSRRAAACGSSPGSISPLGIVHAPASLRAQNGPPMCPTSTSTPSTVPRNSRSPALVRGTSDGRGVDDEAVPHVAVDDAVVRVVHLVGLDGLDDRGDAVLGAEV